MPCSWLLTASCIVSEPGLPVQWEEPVPAHGMALSKATPALGPCIPICHMRSGTEKPWLSRAKVLRFLRTCLSQLRVRAVSNGLIQI